jgi:hypothetical protein
LTPFVNSWIYDPNGVLHDVQFLDTCVFLSVLSLYELMFHCRRKRATWNCHAAADARKWPSALLWSIAGMPCYKYCPCHETLRPPGELNSLSNGWHWLPDGNKREKAAHPSQTAFSLLFPSGNQCQPFERELSSPGSRKVSWHEQYTQPRFVPYSAPSILVDLA